ncbi:hypothetical protein QTP88_001014 [Uroleucon formosanum]
MKTLFGVCDDDCPKETNSNIEKIETSNENMLHIIKIQTTVVKSVVQGIGNASTEMNKLYEELGVKQGEIYKKLNEAANHTHTIETMILSNRIHNIFTALITQFSYETTTISAIITSARTGILHPSLVTPIELANQLTQIKLNLPVNLNLPMGTKPNEIYELSKITKMAVYYSGTQIVFLIKIPLITELELTLFKIIPIPHKSDFNHSIILKPEFQCVGITKNRRQFTTFTETQLLSCTETEIFNICPEFQLIQHESERQPCEVSLFKNPDVLPRNCEAGIIVITKNIYHKLKYANTWIYTTTNDTLTITCQGEQEPHIIKLRNQGVINLNQECRAYANDIVLNPTREIKSKNNIHKFVIMDFEFTMINKTSIVLILGAISNSLDRFKIRTLEGRPLYLPVDEEARPMKDHEIYLAKKTIQRIFSTKTELRDVCLDQLNKSIKAPVNSLNTTYIRNYILGDNKINVLVVWNGSSDRNILKRLGITEFPLLNLTCYDKYFNKIFYLQVERLEPKELIYEKEIGTYDKTGRLLNLTETHGIICNKKHGKTCPHDPRTDVIYTKSIQVHTNPEQGHWYNFTNCFDYHIISANNSILVPYENKEILEIINCVKNIKYTSLLSFLKLIEKLGVHNIFHVDCQNCLRTTRGTQTLRPNLKNPTHYIFSHHPIAYILPARFFLFSIIHVVIWQYGLDNPSSLTPVTPLVHRSSDKQIGMNLATSRHVAHCLSFSETPMARDRIHTADHSSSPLRFVGNKGRPCLCIVTILFYQSRYNTHTLLKVKLQWN